MRAKVHLHEYRILSSAGHLLEAGTGKGIKGAWRELVAKTGVAWSYQIAHRAVTATGIWLDYYRPASSPEILHLILVQRLPTDQSPP